MLRLLSWVIVFVGWAAALHAQRPESAGLSIGAAVSEATRPSAVFALSAGVQLGVPLLVILQRSLAEFDGDSLPGTQRDVSLSLIPVFSTRDARLFGGLGATLNNRRIERISRPDVRSTQLEVTVVGGVRVPIAGPGVLLEMAARVDQRQRMVAALFGVRVRPGVTNSLKLGEPQTVPAVTARTAVWNDVIMQLILLQQDLETFSRIKEIETGIELQFESSGLTLWDDIARVGRVLAAAQPPVLVTVFGPNAGRVAAAMTAGSFPAERLIMERADRVYLRVERQ